MAKLQIVCAVFVLFAASSAFKLQNSPFDPLIVGGEIAEIADFPHSLALLNAGRYSCGASNIHRLWALSAAHCLHSNTPASLVSFLLKLFMVVCLNIGSPLD